MMKITFNNMLKPKEWICIAAGLCLAGIIYAVMIHPSLELFADLEKAAQKKYQAAKELDQIQSRLDELNRLISTAETKLTEFGGSPPMEYEKDTMIEQLTDLAGESQIVIDRYKPIDTIENSDHRAFFVHFIGSGTFKSFKRYFMNVEHKTDYIDITHFTITSDSKDTESNCLLTWSCRINGMRMPDNTHEQIVQPMIGKTSFTEVAFDGP